MSDEQHPFYEMSDLIDIYNTQRENLDLKQLQELRENIALQLFYLSSDAALAIANYEAKDYERKRYYAEKEEYYRNELDDRTGKNRNVADSERLARISAKNIDEETIHALRQKERVRIILNAVNQILNAISGRIAQLSK